MSRKAEFARLPEESTENKPLSTDAGNDTEKKLVSVPKEKPDITEALGHLQRTLREQRDELMKEKTRFDMMFIADPQQARSENWGRIYNKLVYDKIPAMDKMIEDIRQTHDVKDNAGWEEKRDQARRLIAENEEWDKKISDTKAQIEADAWQAKIDAAKAKDE